MNIFLGGNNMFSNSNCASIPLVANIDGNGNNGGWADGGWLWIIVVFALLFGWGNGGFGGWNVEEQRTNDYTLISGDYYNETCSTEEMKQRIAVLAAEIVDN